MMMMMMMMMMIMTMIIIIINYKVTIQLSPYLTSVVTSRQNTSSVGNRAFLAAAPWNNLPSEVTSAQSLHSFRRHLKTFSFQRSFPDVIVTL